MNKTNDRIIVALDLPSVREAEALVDKLGDTVSFYKIGLALTSVGGFELAEKLKSSGKRIFLDLKLFLPYLSKILVMQLQAYPYPLLMLVRRLLLH